MLTEHRDRIEKELREAKIVLDAFPRLPNGLTPDDAKTDEWRAARAKSRSLFEALRVVNASIVKARKSGRATP